MRQVQEMSIGHPTIPVIPFTSPVSGLHTPPPPACPALFRLDGEQGTGDTTRRTPQLFLPQNQVDGPAAGGTARPGLITFNLGDPDAPQDFGSTS